MSFDLTHVTTSNIQRLASTLRPDGEQPCWALNRDRQPFSGGEADVFVVTFSDKTQWAFRLPVHVGHGDAEALTRTVDAEVKVLEKLQSAGFKWSPRLIAFDSGFDNILHFPYIVLTWVPGQHLQWSETVPVLRDQRNKIIRQIVDIQICLANATPFKSEINGYEYMINHIDRQLCRAMKGQLPGACVQDCLMHRLLARMAVDKNIDSTDFMVSHEDLTPGNIIVDDQYNIQGIIDWGMARETPLQFGIGCWPRFLSIELPTMLTDPPSGDTSDVISGYLTAPKTLQEDRTYFLSYLSSRTDSMSLRCYSFLSASDVDWCHRIFGAAISSNMHHFMRERSWLHNASDEEWGLLRAISTSEGVAEFLEGRVARELGLDRAVLEKALCRTPIDGESSNK